MKKLIPYFCMMLILMSGCSQASDALPAVPDTPLSSVFDENLTPTVQITPFTPELPPFNDKSIDTATAFADYFVNMLNIEQDPTGDDGAINSWRDLFDFGVAPIYRSGLSVIEYMDNVYQFIVSGVKRDAVNSATVWINLQGDEPFFYCSYTRYYPFVLQTASTYVTLLAEGNLRDLAVWLGVDGGPEPQDDFLQ